MRADAVTPPEPATAPAQAAAPEIPVRFVQLWLCDPCLDGIGEECHTPGCSLWLNRPPETSIRDGAGVTILDARPEAVAAAAAAQPEVGGEVQRQRELVTEILTVIPFPLGDASSQRKIAEWRERAAQHEQPAPGVRPRFNWPQFIAAIDAFRKISAAGTLEDAHELADEALEAIEDGGQPELADAAKAERERIRRMAIDLHAYAVTRSGKQIPFEEFLRRSPEENAAAIRTVLEGK